MALGFQLPVEIGHILGLIGQTLAMGCCSTPQGFPPYFSSTAFL